MADAPRSYRRNYDSSDYTVYTDISNFTNDIVYTIQEVGFSAPQGKVFKEWNSRQDGQGVSYTPGVVANTADIIYAIWEAEPVSHAVTISYKGEDIATMDATGVKTLLTGDAFCEDDIIVSYTAPTAPAPSLQTKSVTPTESTQTVTPDSGYDGLSEVDVGAISSSYVGTGITRRSSSDLTASGKTVTVPAGYYETAATKDVATGSATTPATTITATPTISVNSSGLITASVSTSKNITPSVTAGYVASGTSGTITVNGSNTNQLTVYNGAHHQLMTA